MAFAGKLRKSLALATATAMLAGVSAAPGTASAQSRQQPQNVFEALFPRLIDERVRRQQQQQLDAQQLQQQEAKPIVKVTGPQYYRYKADKLAKIDLSAIPVPAAAVVAAGQQPAVAVQTSLEARIDQVVLGGTAGDTTGAIGAAQSATTPDQMLEAAAGERTRAFSALAARFAGLQLMAEPEIGKALVAHYKENPRLLWLTNDFKPNARARNALAVLSEAGDYGLDAADYAVELPVSAESGEAALDAAARFEIALTARAIRFILDARHGLVDPNRISGYHDFPKRNHDAGAALKDLAAGLPSKAMREANPQNAAFKALVAELDALQHAQDDVIVIPEGTLIKPGESHEQVPNVIRAIGKRGSAELREKFAALFDPAAPEQTSFTPEVVELVKAFQKEAGLGADGVVGRNTVSRLSGMGVDAKRERVILAMERLRWHPRDLGARHVFINVPAFRARYINGGETRIDMRVVVGTKKNQTSFFHDTIETVEYNPYWGVPQSILVNEYLPKLRENPAYLDERGYEVTDNKGNRIPSSAVDWWSMSGSVPYNVRQSPGEANALGELKILFPNKHAIYMHDTPAKSLFSRDMRAYSHGCVRLAEPRKMAAAVLGKSEEHVTAMLGRGHGQDELAQKFPVYVAYFTAWPTDTGAVEYFGDVYDRDISLRKALDAVEAERAVTG